MYLDDPKIKIIQFCQTLQSIEYTTLCFSVNVQNIMAKYNTRLNENHFKALSKQRLLWECRSVIYYIVFTALYNAGLEII